MNHSPYQHQDPRQLDLEQQMEQALQQQDRQLLSRLELQWVHRFGVDSLPSGFTAAEEPAAPSLADQQPSFVAIAPEKSDVDSEPEQVTAESSEPELVNPGLNRFTSLLRNCLDDVGRVVDSEIDPAIDPEIASDTSVSTLRPVPAAGPQRLRRWLTPVSQNDLPKAS